MFNTIGIVKVPSSTQELQFSLPMQINKIKQYSQQKGYEEIKILEFCNSGNYENKLKNIIKDIQLSDIFVNIFIISIDELKNNHKESFILDDLIKKGKVRIYFIDDEMMVDKYSNFLDIVKWDVGIFVTQKYFGQLKDNVKRGIQYKITSGEWSGKAPFGYINTTICDNLGKNGSFPKNKKWIIPDSKNSIYIQKIYNLYSTGKYSINIVREILNDFRSEDSSGMNKSIFSNQQIYTILRNPFYYGDMMSNGKKYPHKYNPIISYKLYEKCQKVLNLEGFSH